MHNPQDTIIIIGTGWAGYTLAQEFRKLDASAPLLILTANDGQNYYKPELSNALTKQKTVAMLTLHDAIYMADKLNAAIHTNTKVTRIDTVLKQVYTADQCFSYKKLVLACGGEPISLAIGKTLAVNSLYDYKIFMDALVGKKDIAILGSGLIGCEFANDLINVGYNVHVIAPVNYPFENLIAAEIGITLREALRKKGVQWYLQKFPTAINSLGEKYQVILSDESMFEVDVVLSAIGLRPNVKLAETSAIKIGRGILVNEYLETSAHDVYALGDCAEVNGSVLQFIAPILHCAKALAKTLAGNEFPVKYPAMPIILKTPACPIVFLPPPPSCKGGWQIQGQDDNLKALFYDSQHCLRGFALANYAIKEQLSLAKEIDLSAY